MEEHAGSQAQFKSIASPDKKRKLQDELSEMPMPKKIQTQRSARGSESEAESADSNSFNCSSESDTIMSTDDDAKTKLEYTETCSSDTPLASSDGSSAETSSEFSLYSSEITPSTNTSSTEQESLSLSRQPDYLHHSHEGPTREFESEPGFSLLEYEKGYVDQQCLDKELENLLYSNSVAPSGNFILSSGRWSVDQDAPQEGKKLTIDKEFEQYFSMLML